MITLLLEYLLGMRFEAYSFWLAVQTVCAYSIFITLVSTPRFWVTPSRLGGLWKDDKARTFGLLLFWYASIALSVGSGFDLIDGNAPSASRFVWVPLRTEGGACIFLGAVLFHWNLLYWPNIRAFYRRAIRERRDP